MLCQVHCCGRGLHHLHTVSVNDIGAYSFDTRTHLWSKAGDWLLPFYGCAEYVPEYNLWFGLSYDADMLCALDLSAPSVLKPPRLRNLCPPIRTGSKECRKSCTWVPASFASPGTSRLSRRNRLEMASSPDIGSTSLPSSVVRSGKAGRGLRMVTHSSKRYRSM
jgi:hypothetical protein